MDIFKYNRIVIVGNNGSGKSYLSKELMDITGLPLIHLDVEFWRPNWEMPPKDEWIAKQKEFVSREKWIIDGNHTGVTMDMRFEKSDLVIFLDINRLVCLYGVIRRNGKKRSDTTQYPYEKFDKGFFRLCKGLWRFPKARKLFILDLHKKYPDKPFLVIDSRRNMKRLISEWRYSII